MPKSDDLVEKDAPKEKFPKKEPETTDKKEPLDEDEDIDLDSIARVLNG